MKHELRIISLNDAQAECKCLKWAYECTGRKEREEIVAEYQRHLKQQKSGKKAINPYPIYYPDLKYD